PRAVRLGIELPLEPLSAFDVLVDELGTALALHGLRFQRGEGGRITEGEVEVGRVTAWAPGERMLLEWRAAPWGAHDVSWIELRVEPAGAGSAATLEHRGWGRLIGDGGELAGWFASAVVAPYLRGAAPQAFGDWLTDRGARRPTG